MPCASVRDSPAISVRSDTREYSGWDASKHAMDVSVIERVLIVAVREDMCGLACPPSQLWRDNA